MENNFYSVMRINILEMLSYSRVQKNKKRLSIADILNQIQILYMVSERKPSKEEVDEGINYLLKRSYIEKMKIGDVDMYSITERGRDILQRLGEDDITVII